MSSKSQYLAAFKRWGIAKNIKQHEYDKMLPILQQRQTLGRSSNIVAHGYVVKNSKVEKQRSRVAYKSTFDRIRAGKS